MGKKKILVVDDDFDTLKSIEQILEKEGYAVSVATNALQALDQLGEDGFSLILIDVIMPNLSGYELLRILRQKYNHSLPMIFMSIKPRAEINLKEADGFIQKPFSKKLLVDCVAKLVG